MNSGERLTLAVHSGERLTLAVHSGERLAITNTGVGHFTPPITDCSPLNLITVYCTNTNTNTKTNTLINQYGSVDSLQIVSTIAMCHCTDTEKVAVICYISGAVLNIGIK